VQDVVTLQKFALDVCKGMIFLERYPDLISLCELLLPSSLVMTLSSHGFVHWDLAARNILLHNRTCKITNLGLCKVKHLVLLRFSLLKTSGYAIACIQKTVITNKVYEVESVADCGSRQQWCLLESAG
jgi:hypothetical protein